MVKFETIPEEFWEEMTHFKNIVILVSGGKDSTYLALEFKKRNIEASLLFNNTGLAMPESLKTLTEIMKLTGYQLHMSIAENSIEIVKETFKRIDLLDETIPDEVRRKIMYCCNKLKKNPSKKLAKILYDPSDTIFIRGDRPTENRHRYARLAQIRKLGTFIRFLKTMGYWYAFPLRDMKKPPIVKEIEGIKSSGCAVCPALLIYRMMKNDPKRYIASRKFYIKVVGGKFCSKLDHTLDDFIWDYVYCDFCGEKHPRGECKAMIKLK